MRKSELHEILAQLYLRLNGYFTTGLILPSPKWGQARTEIDCLAIRHPYHSQTERVVETADFLGTNDGKTELIFCEVKSDLASLQFNAPLRDDREALRAALRWAGVFTQEQVDSVADRLRPLLQEDASSDAARIGVVENSYRVRALLCCPPSSEAAEGKWCLLGPEIFGFADRCFNPPERRDSCSTRYNFQQWGYPFAPVVTYLKNGGTAKSLEGLYQYIGAT